MSQEKIQNMSVSSGDGRNCALCNTILEPRTRSHQLIALRTDTEHHVNIKNIIKEKLMPLEVPASQFICHPCWQKADRAAKKLSGTSSSGSSLRCANCGIKLIRQKRHILHCDAILLRIQQRVAPKEVTANDYICDACHKLFVDSTDIKTSHETQEAAAIGHEHICLTCGVSVARTRSHSLEDESNHHILYIVQNWIQPQKVEPSASICHRCYQRADTAVDNIEIIDPDDPSVPEQVEVDSITLPNYKRASNTHRRCIFPECRSTSHKVVPSRLRVRLFKDNSYYIPPGCRICEFHLRRQSWTELFEAENVIRSFTASHIEDFSQLLKIYNSKTLDLIVTEREDLQ